MAYTDKLSIKTNVSDDDSWYVFGDKHYCPNCWKIDDDNLVLDEKRKGLFKEN